MLGSHGSGGHGAGGGHGAASGGGKGSGGGHGAGSGGGVTIATWGAASTLGAAWTLGAASPGRLICSAELTLAPVTPAMAELIPLAEQSRADAEAQIDALWTPVPTAA